MKKIGVIYLALLIILLLPSCSSRNIETTGISSIDSNEDTLEISTTQTQISFAEGVYQTKEAKGTMPGGYELHPYIFFELVDHWRIGSDQMFSYGRSGRFTQNGDIIKAMRQEGVGAPLNENLYIEFQILSETELKVVKVSEDFYTSFGATWEWLVEGDLLEYQDPESISTEASADLPESAEATQAVLAPPKQFVGTWIGVSNSRAKIDINADGTAAINGRAAAVIFVQNDVNGRIIKLISKNKTLAFEYKLQGGNAMTSIGDDGDLAFYRQGTAHPIEQFVGKWITDSEKPPEWGEPIKEFTIAPNLEIQINNGETIQLEFNYLNLISKDSKVMDCMISKDGNTLRFQLMGAGYAYYRRVPQE